MTLEDLGWNAAFETAWAACAGQGLEPACLIRDNKITCGALTGDGEEYEVVMSGKVYHDAETDAELPAVGDWGGAGDRRQRGSRKASSVPAFHGSPALVPQGLQAAAPKNR